MNMKTTNINNRIKRLGNIRKMGSAAFLLLSLSPSLLFLTACTDFSDYNDTPVDAVATGNQTLWENISQNPQLSEFASLIRQTGFETELANSRSYTVWAPLNGTINTAELSQLSNSELLKQFVQSHVAEYSHAASGEVNERVHTLNEKSFTFAGNGSYTYDGNNISQPNLPSSNGVMHIMDGAAKFYPNLYEYLSMGSNIDSLRNQFMKYELTVLDQDASVKGPMVDGIQTYIDSVLVTSNSLTRQLNAKIENEDSSYTFLMPTNHAFKSMYDRVSPCFKFITTTLVQDVENFTSASATNSKSVSVSAAYLKDSLTRRAIVRNLIYSNNDAYNQWVEQGGVYTDTLRSTTRSKFSNPREILAQTVGEKQPMSNGFARLVDSLAFYPWESYCPEIEVPFTRYLAKHFTSSLHNVNATNWRNVFGPDPVDFRYMWIEPSGPFAKPDFFISLPDVQSTTYDIYCVFLPSARLTNRTDTLPNSLNFSLSYCNEKGQLATYNFTRAAAESQAAGETPKTTDVNPKSLNINTAFVNNPEVTDTMFIGRFTFPVCYAGLGNYSPNIHITSPISVFNATQMSTYTRDVRIYGLLMKPVELVEFERNNK